MATWNSDHVHATTLPNFLSVAQIWLRLRLLLLSLKDQSIATSLIDDFIDWMVTKYFFAISAHIWLPNWRPIRVWLSRLVQTCVYLPTFNRLLHSHRYSVLSQTCRHLSLLWVLSLVLGDLILPFTTKIDLSFLNYLILMIEQRFDVLVLTLVRNSALEAYLLQSLL